MFNRSAPLGHGQTWPALRFLSSQADMTTDLTTLGRPPPPLLNLPAT